MGQCRLSSSSHLGLLLGAWRVLFTDERTSGKARDARRSEHRLCDRVPNTGGNGELQSTQAALHWRVPCHLNINN